VTNYQLITGALRMYLRLKV